MHLLYDSDSYSVMHMLANAIVEDAPLDVDGKLDGLTTFVLRVPVLVRDGFEIIDKNSNKEVYLEGSWADLFRKHITAWELKTPTQEEIEDTLAQYAELAQNPVLVH